MRGHWLCWRGLVEVGEGGWLWGCMDVGTVWKLVVMGGWIGWYSRM